MAYLNEKSLGEIRASIWICISNNFLMDGPAFWKLLRESVLDGNGDCGKRSPAFRLAARNAQEVAGRSCRAHTLGVPRNVSSRGPPRQRKA
jgi:hypothetical protein